MISVDRAAPPQVRLLQGMAIAVAAKGFAALTIADVVAEAGVSKRTFYEHFTGKEDCLLATYDVASELLMARVREVVAGMPPDRDRIVAGLEAYLAALDDNGVLSRALLLEVQVAGPAGWRIRREKNLKFARMIRDLAGDTSVLDADQSLALVGGLQELMLAHADSRPDTPFHVLAPSLARFVFAVLGLGEPAVPADQS